MSSLIVTSKKTRAILESTIPKWMEKLTSVNFDGKKLNDSEKETMSDSPTGCFIGELHKGNGLYEYCRECHKLALLAPLKFLTAKFPTDPENFMMVFDSMNTRQFLKRVADHIEESHEDLINEARENSLQKGVSA